MNSIIIIVFLFFIMVGMMFIWKELLSIFFPYIFYRIEILKDDNSVLRKILLKGKNNFFKYKEINYWFTDKNPYYEKGVRKFFFKEGEREPIDFRSIKLERNLELEKRFFEMNLHDMLTGGRDKFKNFMANWGIIIIAGCVLLILFLMWRSGSGTPNVPT